MKTLALELSSGQGSIAWRDGAVVSFANDRKHSGLFFENLQRALETGGKPERIVVGLGPGSYAGTRIAIATAIGLSSATGAELVGLPSLCAMAVDAIAYAVIGDARRQSFFFARVRARRCVEGPMLCTQDELAARLDALGSPVFTAEALPAFSHVPVAHPSARLLAEIDSPEIVRAPLEPIYLREPHITRPK